MDKIEQIRRLHYRITCNKFFQYEFIYCKNKLKYKLKKKDDRKHF